MNELIQVTYDNERPTVLGRDLHQVLEVETRYNDWFKRMCEYGFTEGLDYYSFLSNRSDGLSGKPRANHQLTIDMAKEICMLQRNERGKQARQYFIQLEKEWNSPEKVMARALKIADMKILSLQTENTQQKQQIEEQKQQIEEMKPKATYYDIVLNCNELLPISVISKDYGKTAQWLNNYLHEKGIQYKQGNVWLLYKDYADRGYTQTKTRYHYGKTGLAVSVHTCWTQKGRLFLYDLLKKDGHIPTMELERESA